MASPHKLTLITIAEEFQTFATQEKAIAQFSIGSNWEYNQDYKLEYPHLFFEFPSLIESNRTSKTFHLAFLVLDRTFESAPGQRQDIEMGGATKVLSKTDQIVDNLIAFLWASDFKRYMASDFTFSRIPIIEDSSDRVYGWRVETILKAEQNLRVCDPG